MIVNTTHFGSLALSETTEIEFPDGLPGFEEYRRFVPVQHANSPGLIFLQSMDRPNLCFITVPVRTLWPDYALVLSTEDRDALGMDASPASVAGSEIAVLAIVSFVEGEEPTANLLAPVAVHVANRRAVQVIRTDGRYQAREALPAGEPVCS